MAEPDQRATSSTKSLTATGSSKWRHTESIKGQCALRERALAIGWPLDQIVVIDSDLGQSGADSDRLGFQSWLQWSAWARSVWCSDLRSRAWLGIRPTDSLTALLRPGGGAAAVIGRAVGREGAYTQRGG